MTTKAKAATRSLAVFALSLFLCQCSVPMAGSNSSYEDSIVTKSRAESRTVSERKSRPGLGTTWGEARDSHVDGTSFVRASSSPSRRLAIRYNDADGIPAGRWSARQPFDLGSVASVGIKSGGRYLKCYGTGSDPVVVGRDGERYSIYVKNHTNERIEVVLSVDGLDVLDGKSASTRKRGYVIAPRGRLTVEGFRRSFESVAAFRFGSVDSSYAARSTGSTRNVGVIGAAVFKEKANHDWNVRKNADPFPGERGSGSFAHPPRR